MIGNVRLDAGGNRYKHIRQMYITHVHNRVRICMNSYTYAHTELQCTLLPELSPEPMGHLSSICVTAAFVFR